MTKKLHNQKRIPGLTRIPSSSLLLPKLRKCVERDALKHNVSKSWVVAVILADFYNINEQERY